MRPPLSQASVEMQTGKSLEQELGLSLPPRPLLEQPPRTGTQLAQLERTGLRLQGARPSGALLLLPLSSSGRLMLSYCWIYCEWLFHTRINIDCAL